MLWTIVSSSVWFRRSLYLPMLLAIVISLALIGAADIVGSSFNAIVAREMGKYGANVILMPEGEDRAAEGVAVSVKTVKFRDAEVSLATANIAALLGMNPAWVVKGSGNMLIGKSVAERFGLSAGDVVEVEEAQGQATILNSGTDFDTFIVVQGTVEKPSMILIRTEEPEKYRGKNAVILAEMVRAKYIFLESIKRLMFCVSMIAAVASLATVVNLARMDAGERRREFGVLKALGAWPRTIARVVAAEFAALACAAGILGVLAALALSWALLTFVAGASPAVSFRAAFYVFASSFAAFGVASLIYLLESRKHEVAEELRGE